MGLRNSESALDLINIISLGKNSFLDTTSTWFEMCIKQTASLKKSIRNWKGIKPKTQNKTKLKKQQQKQNIHLLFIIIIIIIIIIIKRENNPKIKTKRTNKTSTKRH